MAKQGLKDRDLFNA